MADITITPANVAPSVQTNSRGIAAAAIAAGDVIAFDPTGKLIQADANSATSPEDVPIGIAVCSGATGQPVLYVSTDPNLAIGGTTASGIPYFLSGNPGKICVAADLVTGMKTSLIGFGATGNKMSVRIIPSGHVV
jgi:hypothetical protein